VVVFRVFIKFFSGFSLCLSVKFYLRVVGNVSTSRLVQMMKLIKKSPLCANTKQNKQTQSLINSPVFKRYSLEYISSISNTLYWICVGEWNIKVSNLRRYRARN
jgi:hypothetical protein